jgi:hypothetical protein
MGSRARELVEEIKGVLEPRNEILEAYLFGSHVRGEATAHSDIDVAVFVAAEALVREPAFGYDSHLAADLMRALKTDKVDVVVLNRASPVLYHRVLRDGERILSRDLAATTTREGRALSRYCDYVPQLKKIDEALQRRIERGEFGR